MFVVTFDQVWPPSRVSCTRPSSVPTQMVFASSGEIAKERIVSKGPAPLRSSSTGPPLLNCLLLSLRVRSGLMGFQCAPLSVDLNNTLPPRYTSFGSEDETAIGVVQLNRYFRSAVFIAPTPKRYGRRDIDRPLVLSKRWMDPF